MDGEIIARVDRRRQWTSEEKAALLAEVEATGGRVSVVARRHGCRRACCIIGDRPGRRRRWSRRVRRRDRRDLSSRRGYGIARCCGGEDIQAGSTVRSPLIVKIVARCARQGQASIGIRE